MPYLPIFLDVAGRKCLVVGGGEVAYRKVTSLLEAGADVVVVSPAVSSRIADLARAGRIRHHRREYATSDMEGAALVYAATCEAVVQQRLYDEARAHGILINVADAPQMCTFIAPAVLTRGPLKIAVSTGGASPGMAKRIVKRLERLFGPEYALALEVMRAARQHLQAVESNIQTRATKLTVLAASRIPECLRKGDIDAVNKILLRNVGAGLEALGFGELLNGKRMETATESTPAAR